MSTRHQLPGRAEQLPAQLRNPPTPPPVPCHTYRSTEGERQQRNIIDDAQSSNGSHLPAVLETDGESESHHPISSCTYRVTEASPHNLQSTISIDDEIAQLDEAYLEMESLVLETIKQRGIPVKKMLQWVQVLPMVLKAQFSELLQTQAKAMSTAANVDELFLIIAQYWNSLHPSLLEHLIKKLQDDNLKDRMSSYIKDLCNFRIRTTLGDFVDKWVGRVPPGLDEFIMELGEAWRDKTMHDLEQLRIQLSRQKCLNGLMPYMKKVVSGSICVVFAVSRSVFPLKFQGKAIQHLLKEYEIQRVKVEGQCVLDLVCYVLVEHVCV